MIKFSDLVSVKTAKAEPKARTPGVVKGRFKIQKSDDDKMLAFGFAYVSKDIDGNQAEDYSGDITEIEEIEKAAYQFVQYYRDGSDNHERGGVANLIESIVFTKEKQTSLGIPEGTVPEGWFVGFQITDPDVWEKVKSGEYMDFSIEGEAIREEITETE